MKKHSSEKRKLNNSGLTLIEVLIAMTLLTICIVPMMRAFTQVNRFGEKGRNLQQATTIAQTAMENCKAYNMNDIHANMEAGSFMDSKAAYMAGAQYKTQEYGTYFINNMNVDGQKVGMSIELMPISATSQSITKYENCNDKLDAVFVASKAKGKFADGVEYTYDELESKNFEAILEDVGDYIEGKITKETVVISNDELRENLFISSVGNTNFDKVQFTRTFTITAYTDASGFDVAKVNCYYTAVGNGDYTYTFSDGTTETVSLLGSAWNGTPSPTTTETLIYSNSASKDKKGNLERIYFYYYPAYNIIASTENPCKVDMIVVDTSALKDKNGDPKEIDVYLIKQKLYGKTDMQISLGESETYYKNYLEIKAGGSVNLYHNFNVNIGKEENPDDPSANDLNWPETGEFGLTSGICNNKAGLVESETKNLMYTIKIKMYKNPVLSVGPGSTIMSGEEILTLDGTKINW